MAVTVTDVFDLAETIKQAFITEGFDCNNMFGYGFTDEEITKLIGNQRISRLLQFTDLDPTAPMMRDTGGVVTAMSINMYTFSKKSKDAVEKLHEWLISISKTEFDNLGNNPTAPFDFPSTTATLRIWEWRPVGLIPMSATRYGHLFGATQPIQFEGRKI